MVSVALSLGLVLFIGASKCNPSKNKARGGVLALGGRRLVRKYNNQPKDDVFRGGDIGEGARPGWNVCGGGRFGIVWGSKSGDEKNLKTLWSLTATN
jgi:hypothetical protein